MTLASGISYSRTPLLATRVISNLPLLATNFDGKLLFVSLKATFSLLASCYDSRKLSYPVAYSRMPHAAVPQARKKALREWFYQQPPPRPSLQACIHWFEAQYGHRLDKSMVSRYLSDSYSRLDSTASSTLLINLVLQESLARSGELVQS
jgi:hypothetical protein